MSDYILRPMTLADAPQGAALWSLVFGDDEALVREFFRLFAHTPHFGVCAELDGTIAAAAYCPQGTDYVAVSGEVRKGAYLYAVATHPDHRKRGLAAKLCRLLKEQVFSAGCAYLFTKPSEESLYPWYAEKIGAVPTMGMQSAAFDRGNHSALSVTPLSPADYMARREAALQGLPHVRHNENWAQWAHLLHQAYGGEFCTVGGFIADYFSDGTTLQINELLPHPTMEQAQQAAQALMHHTNTNRCSCTLYGKEHYVSAVTQNDNPPEGWFGVCYG